MSHRRKRFNATFSEEPQGQASFDDSENMIVSIESTTQTERTSYNFGTGLVYDVETNTLSADSENEVVSGSDKLVTSGAVQTAIDTALREIGASYAADERIAGVWFDGQTTMYERCITVSDVSIHNDRMQSFAHGIENVDKMIVTEAYLSDPGITRANSNMVNVIGSVNIGGRAITLQWVADDTYIWINSEQYFNANENRTWRITVRYTKHDD